MPHQSSFWVNLDDKQIKVRIPGFQQGVSLQKQQSQFSNNLDILGRPVNIKVENFLDKMC